MSRTITFHGASDDLVEISGAPGADQPEDRKDAETGEWNVHEINCYAGAWDIVSASGRLRVHAVYDGCWAFAPGAADEPAHLPGWPITVRLCGENDYSVELVVEAPDDALITSIR